MRGARKTADASWRGVESAGKPWTWVRCGMIGTRRCEGVGLLISGVQVFEDSFDHIDIGDERVDAHVAAAVSVTNAVRIAGSSAASPAAADTPPRNLRRSINSKTYPLAVSGAVRESPPVDDRRRPDWPV